MTEIYLIRHAQAEGNRYRMMQGFWDGGVTDLGKKQIEALEERFRDFPMDAVYSSDLKRAVMTAEAVARRDGGPIRTSRQLREINIGPWEKKFFGNVCHETPDLANTFMYDAENWQMDGAETYAQVRDRALAELKKIARENDGKRIAVISHGVTIRCLLWAITGIPLADVKAMPISRNTAVSKLIWDGESFHAEYLNDASHLPLSAQTSWSTAGDVRDEPLDPARDRVYYEACYEDAWCFSHGSLKGYSPDVYFQAAKQHLHEMPGSVMRLYHGDEPVGLIDLDPKRGAEDKAGWISLLYLKEEYRNKGYGIQALARPIFFYKALGRHALRLQVAEANGLACAFYRREGFRVTGEQQGVSGRLFLMERKLEMN